MKNKNEVKFYVRKVATGVFSFWADSFKHTGTVHVKNRDWAVHIIRASYPNATFYWNQL
jgi:hypothetical protein